MTAIHYRQAGLDDAADVLALLMQVAPEIPLLVETLEREEALYALIRNCARSGESWVAVDAAPHLVGFLLAEPNQRARHYAEHEIIELRYAGVRPDRRNQGIFGGLLGHVLARMVPVIATVAPQNRSGAAGLLERRGFQPARGAAGTEAHLRWEPGRT